MGSPQRITATTVMILIVAVLKENELKYSVFLKRLTYEKWDGVENLRLKVKNRKCISSGIPVGLFKRNPARNEFGSIAKDV